MRAANCILVVEDEWVLAAEMEDLLEDAGFEVVGPVSTVAAALALVERNGVHAAILDIDLTHEMSYPIAEALMERRIPFVFVSGYTPSDLPVRFRACRHISKPADPQAVLAFLTNV